MGGPFLEDEDDVNNLADFGAAGGGIPNPPMNLPRPPRRRGFQRPNTMYNPQVDAASDFASNAILQHQLGVSAYNEHLNDVNKTIGDEMKSRVAQAREMRRMEHEQAMKQMELDALLARLDAESKSRPADGPQPRAVFPGGTIY